MFLSLIFKLDPNYAITKYLPAYSLCTYQLNIDSIDLPNKNLNSFNNNDSTRLKNKFPEMINGMNIYHSEFLLLKVTPLHILFRRQLSDFHINFAIGRKPIEPQVQQLVHF